MGIECRLRGAGFAWVFWCAEKSSVRARLHDLLQPQLGHGLEDGTAADPTYPWPMKKRYWRAYADDQGESHLEEIEADLVLSDFAPPSPPLFVSSLSPALGFAYLHAPEGWDGGWHPSPRRQLFIVLRGSFEGEVSDGRSLEIGPGKVVLLEDTSGKGHTTRVKSSGGADALVIALP
jgi:hypothetical protein